MACTFYFTDGRTADSPEELLAVLKVVDDPVFSYHCNREKNDFFSWINDGLGLADLARSIKRTRTRLGLVRKLTAHLKKG